MVQAQLDEQSDQASDFALMLSELPPETTKQARCVVLLHALCGAALVVASLVRRTMWCSCFITYSVFVLPILVAAVCRCDTAVWYCRT